MPMAERLNAALYSAKPSPIRAFSNLAARTPGCIRLTLGEPDFPTPAPVRAQVPLSLEAGHTHYIANNGTPALREAIAAFERRENGLDYPPEDIIVTAGATEALFCALFGILDPGDEVIVPTPAFVLYERILGLCRAAMIPLDTTPYDFQLRPEALAPLITPRTKAILLNSPHNPTGTVYDRESLRAVCDAVKDREIFVICDDVYRRLCYDGEYHSFAEYRELKDRLLVVQSFSKSWAMTGWRMGYLMADGPVCRRLELLHQFLITSTPAPFQEACITALAQPTEDMAAVYRARRDRTVSRLNAMGLPVKTPGGAFYVFPSIARFGMDSTAFCTRLLAEAGVAVTPGAAFGADDHIRVSYCCGTDRLTEGLDRLERFITTLEDRA